MAYVYTHSKPNGEIFYVGIGVVKKRAYSKHGRNQHWHNTVKKYGYEVKILINDADYETAKQCESYLIKYYGRKDLGLGSLVNFTDGGEGYSNMNDEEKAVRAERMRIYNKTKKDYSFTQNEDYKLKMKKSCIGNNAKRIVNTQTNKVYSSLREASKAECVNYTCLSQMLNGSRVNKTNLKWK